MFHRVPTEIRSKERNTKEAETVFSQKKTIFNLGKIIWLVPIGEM